MTPETTLNGVVTKPLLVKLPPDHVPPKNKQWSFLSTTALLLAAYSGLIYVSWKLHYTLPTPQVERYGHDGTPQFSEVEGMRYINDMASYADGTPKYRIVGTEEMLETEKYLIKEVERIRDESVNAMPAGLHQIEIFHQIDSGEHLFDFMEKMVWKKYYNITNVIVRLSDGTPTSKANAVLVNAHTDSTLPSPGAADDLVGVAAMLEALRVLAMSPRRLTNSVVFLFNGAEESLQDASHMFITKHPLRSTIRAVINLEACGVAGPEIVFQATSSEMIRALSYTPRPYGTVLATEVFSTGLIVSDTDFRQFAQYGNLTGLDMALVENSYLYHTRQDLPEKLQPGALQHMGENTLALLNYLTSNKTIMGNSMTAENLPKIQTSSTIYFSGLGGHMFLIYTRAQATLYYGVIAAVAVVVVTDRIDWSRKGLYLATTLGIFGSFVTAMVCANLAAFVSGILLSKPMAWFRHESLPILMYAPPAALGAVLLQRTLSNFIRTPFASMELELEESSLMEHATLTGQVIYYTILLLVGHAAGVGSSYLFMLAAVNALFVLIVNDYVLKQKSRRSLHLFSYVLGQVSPLLFGAEGLVGFLDLFVPLTGRIGADAPVDFIIASLVGGVGYLTIPMLLPFSHRYGATMTARIGAVLACLTVGILLFFTRPGWNVFDAEHPRRLLVLHMENTTVTPPQFDLHVASIDGTPFYDLVVSSTQSLLSPGVVPVPLESSDYTTEWDIIFPISAFVRNYKVPLPPTPATYSSPWTNTFKVIASRSILNSVKRTRLLDIVMEHPDIMWPVIAFTADVVQWDLPQPPERGIIRHHVKSVAAWGVSRFSLSVVLALSENEFAAASRQSQRAKGQRADTSEADKILGSFKVDYSGLDRHGMYPASSRHHDPAIWKPGMSFFEEMEKNLPPEVDAMLLSAIAGVAYI